MLTRLARAKRATSAIERPSASQSRAWRRRKGRARRTRLKAFRSRCRSPGLKAERMPHVRPSPCGVQKFFQGYLVMAGRTHGQHAVPMTFGFKVAGWIDELNRHVTRLRELGLR